MPANRKFDFPVSTLIRDAKRLLGALVDPVTGPAVARRLLVRTSDSALPGTPFAIGFEAQIKLVEKGGADQSGAFGGIGQMTEEQAAAFTELERLMAGARRSAALAFPSNDARLHSEFQVGIHEPQDFASEIERARKICAACEIHAAALAVHGWIDEDTTGLAAAINVLDDGDGVHEAAKDQKKGFTKGRNLAANTLYKMCQSVQNAARLAYPGINASKDEAVLVARNRFLLDEFPPRGGASAGDKPAPPTPPVA
jgi:hypothetical protein